MRNRYLALLPALALLAGACRTDGSSSTSTPPSPAPAESGGGWIGGAPPNGKAAPGTKGAADGGREMASAASTTASVAAAAPDAPGTTRAPNQQSALRAGSVDDNAKFDEYLSYRQRFAKLGVAVRDVDPTGRIVVTVKGSDQLPAAGREVVATRDGKDIARLRSTADGTIRFFPKAYGAPDDSTYTFSVGSASVTAKTGTSASLSLKEAAAPQGSIPVDVLFLLDATGSMGDEIGQLKTSIDSIAQRLTALPVKPDLRLGMTVYRDQGDAYLTRTFDFTADVAQFRSGLGDVTAGGGGDKPEALDEALAAALREPKWRANALPLVFLVADAGPHIERQLDQPYDASMKAAAGRGVKIFPVASSGTDDLAEYVFRQLAQFTGGRFVFMSYGAGGAALGGGSDIRSTDYEELSLDDLVVRLVAEELEARTGQKVVVPTTSSTTTRPAGQ